MIWGSYGTTRVALASGGAIAAGDQLIPSTLTDTTGTAAARPYAFLQGADISIAATTSQDTVQKFIIPHAVTLAALATATGITGTVPQTFDVFIRGL